MTTNTYEIDTTEWSAYDHHLVKSWQGSEFLDEFYLDFSERMTPAEFESVLEARAERQQERDFHRYWSSDTDEFADGLGCW